MAGMVFVVTLAAMLMAGFGFPRSGSAAAYVFVATKDTRVVEMYPTN